MGRTRVRRTVGGTGGHRGRVSPFTDYQVIGIAQYVVMYSSRAGSPGCWPAARPPTRFSNLNCIVVPYMLLACCAGPCTCSWSLTEPQKTCALPAPGRRPRSRRLRPSGRASRARGARSRVDRLLASHRGRFAASSPRHTASATTTACLLETRRTCAPATDRARRHTPASGSDHGANGQCPAQCLARDPEVSASKHR